MDTGQFGDYEQRLEGLVPALVDDLVAVFKEEPSIANRYRPEELRPMAEQAVTSFTNILVGALQFDAPQLVARELNWVKPLLAHRNIEGEQINRFLEVFSKRLKAELPATDSKHILNFLEKVRVQTEETGAEGKIG